MKRDTRIAELEVQVKTLQVLVESMALRISLLESRPVQYQYYYPPVVSPTIAPPMPAPFTTYISSSDTLV